MDLASTWNEGVDVQRPLLVKTQTGLVSLVEAGITAQQKTL